MNRVNVFKHLADSLLVVGHAYGNRLLLAVGELELDERVGKTDFLDAALGEHSLGVAVDEFIFYA